MSIPNQQPLSNHFYDRLTLGKFNKYGLFWSSINRCIYSFGMIIFFYRRSILEIFKTPKESLFFPSQLFYWELCFTSFLNLKVFNEGLVVSLRRQLRSYFIVFCCLYQTPITNKNLKTIFS